ncbi:MAG: helix-turn-helix domain-containing protein [Kiritimatiellia bacterium]|jgi:predicted DNA-binding transcriptional regulator AlpA|nr:helix-turn-helix domain-containing protein [Kiritimatiellia bacterium]MDD4172724.1 helix-turn-helix domain-containing protein [Kiritimatiellia bacterium]MDD4440794.1 helix-turn-helix domain-containing protein [Kiritimatiellia bacterium]MDX9792126.1 helix-turn-helix domain-containing protein [Kiritimatiellia bacterium]
MAELTNDLLAAVLAATPDRKSAALRALRGEVDDGGPAKRVLPEPFVTQRELSRHLGLSVPTLWRYRVPKHGLGGRPRFRVSEVLAYLESPEFKVIAEELKAERRAARKTK